MCKTPITQSRERGLTLVESLMVLGIATAFVGGGLALYSQANNSARVRTALQDVHGVIAAARTQYAAQNHYAGASLDEIGWHADTNPWGADYVLTPDGTSGSEENFYITLGDVPETSCKKLLTMFGSSDGIDIKVGAGGKTPPDGNDVCDTADDSALYIKTR